MNYNIIEKKIDEANEIYKKGMKFLKEDRYEEAIKELSDARDFYEDIYNEVDKNDAKNANILKTIDEIIEECDEMIEECKIYIDYKKDTFVSDLKDFYGDNYEM